MISLIVFVSIALVAIIVSIYYQHHIENKFISDGVETVGTIQKLSHKRVFQRIAAPDYFRQNKYYISVTYFSQPAKEESNPKKKVIEKDSTGTYKLNLGNPSAIIGEYYETELRVSSSFYNNHKVGDKVSILYLPDSPKEIMLKEDVE